MLGSTGALAEGEGTRAAVGAGLAVPAWNRSLYDAGLFAQGGVDAPLGSGETQRLRLLGRWLGLAATGMRSDTVSLEASWRVYPPWGRGLLFEIGSGAMFEVERLRLSLPSRDIDASNTRAGMPVSLAVGFGLWRRAEIEAGFQQFLFFREQPRAVGIAHLSLGGRL